jgi:carbonic anhydrase
MARENMMEAQAALEKLREGNRRFAADACKRTTLACRARRYEVANSQEPFAVILGCSDSRVPAEIIFDQGLGDLFVIRVAGNIVAPSQVGSIEFAAEHYGSRLVVVLGHSHCGAIIATLEELAHGHLCPSENQRCIVDRIRPALQFLAAPGLAPDSEALIQEAVRANIRASVSQLRHGASEALERLIQTDGLLVIGAEYSLESGLVHFFEGADAPPAVDFTPSDPQ